MNREVQLSDESGQFDVNNDFSKEEKASEKLAVITPGMYYRRRVLHGAVDVIVAFTILLFGGSGLSRIFIGLEELFYLPPSFFAFVALPMSLFLVIFLVKWLSSAHNWLNLGMKVVTRDGCRLSTARAAVRSLAFCFTWFLIPVHLAFIAVGSRRFLHDLMSDTYVLMDGEVPERTVYPPPPRWIAPTLVVLSICVAMYVCNAGAALMQAERAMVGALVGDNTPAYLRYLKVRYGKKTSEIATISKLDAETFLPLYQQIADLEVKHGPQSVESVKYLYQAAMLASTLERADVSDRYLVQFLRCPVSVTKEAFAERLPDSFIDGRSPKLMAANLYRWNGQMEKALSLALSEKATGVINHDSDKFVYATKQIILIYQTQLAAGKNDRDYSQLCKQEGQELIAGLDAYGRH